MKLIDLFSGCGGMSLGFQQAGFEVVGAFDNWAPAVKIYESNFGHPIHQIDLTDESVIELIKEGQPDIIVGGPPCQDYSIAGKRQLGDRANLTIRFGEIAAIVQPTWVVFENVYNIERFPTLPKLIEILKNVGYGVSSHVLDASKCGVPQKRRRYFLIARLGAVDGFIDDEISKNMAKESMTVRDYLGNSLMTDYYYMHPRSYERRAVFSIDEPAATVRGINRPIPSNYKRHRADKAQISDGVRALTTVERSQLQTFPLGFKLPGGKTDVELAIGNAVPPALARFLACAILEYQSRQGNEAGE